MKQPIKHTIKAFIVSILGVTEKLLYKKKSKTISAGELATQGFSYGDNAILESLTFKIEKLHHHSKYYVSNILTRSSINSVAENLLNNKEVKEKLSGFFNGPYCIGFITHYTTSSLPEELTGQSVYANHWHLDNMLTENCVKIILLPQKINDRQGPLHIFSKDNSDLLQKSGFTRGNEVPEDLIDQVQPLVFLGEESQVLFARTHVCFHAAGVPDPGYSREQIMVQLNPSRTWSYHKDLYEKQFEREPTLALLKNPFRPKVTI